MFFEALEVPGGTFASPISANAGLAMPLLIGLVPSALPAFAAGVQSAYSLLTYLLPYIHAHASCLRLLLNTVFAAFTGAILGRWSMPGPVMLGLSAGIMVCTGLASAARHLLLGQTSPQALAACAAIGVVLAVWGQRHLVKDTRDHFGKKFDSLPDLEASPARTNGGKQYNGMNGDHGMNGHHIHAGDGSSPFGAQDGTVYVDNALNNEEAGNGFLANGGTPAWLPSRVPRPLSPSKDKANSHFAGFWGVPSSARAISLTPPQSASAMLAALLIAASGVPDGWVLAKLAITSARVLPLLVHAGLLAFLKVSGRSDRPDHMCHSCPTWNATQSKTR